MDTTPASFFPIILALGWPRVTFPSSVQVRYDWDCGCSAMAVKNLARALKCCTKHDGLFSLEDSGNTIQG